MPTVWTSPPANVSIAPEEVHVWRIVLQQPAELRRELLPLLSEEERARMARFQFERLQQSFLVSHGALRHILAQYAGLAPTQLTFAYSLFGKPALAPESDLRFNLSHSENLALVAVTQGHELGVDIECVRAVPKFEQIAARNFSPREFELLCALAPEEKLGAFFNCWTRKEAVVKAFGRGLNMPLDQFEVAFASFAKARLLSLRGCAEAAAHWSLFALHPAHGYAAALAVHGAVTKLSCWNWRE